MTLKFTKQKYNKILGILDLTLQHVNNITTREFPKVSDMLKAAIPVLNMVIFTFFIQQNAKIKH